MNTNVNTATGAAVDTQQINYAALIRAYKVVREFKKLKSSQITETLRNSYEAWRNEEKHAAEKDIAEMVVIDEMMYAFFFGEEINQKLGFELIPPDKHL
jgi:hypothetical protein